MTALPTTCSPSAFLPQREAVLLRTSLAHVAVELGQADAEDLRHPGEVPVARCSVAALPSTNRRGLETEALREFRLGDFAAFSPSRDSLTDCHAPKFAQNTKLRQQQT